MKPLRASEVQDLVELFDVSGTRFLERIQAPLIVYDFDGTLSDNSRRLHLLGKPEEYFAEAINDTPTSCFGEFTNLVALKPTTTTERVIILTARLPPTIPTIHSWIQKWSYAGFKSVPIISRPSFMPYTESSQWKAQTLRWLVQTFGDYMSSIRFLDDDSENIEAATTMFRSLNFPWQVHQVCPFQDEIIFSSTGVGNVQEARGQHHTEGNCSSQVSNV